MHQSLNQYEKTCYRIKKRTDDFERNHFISCYLIAYNHNGLDLYGIEIENNVIIP